MDGVSHNDTVRGKVIIISTLTPSLSRQRERGVAIFFPLRRDSRRWLFSQRVANLSCEIVLKE
jgi:hypothetical protein